MACHVCLHAAVAVEHVAIGGKQAAHVVPCVQAVEAFGGVGYVVLPFVRAHPAVYLAPRSVEHELYLGEELLARAVTQARGYESHCLLISRSRHAVHEGAWVGGEEICRFVFVGKLADAACKLLVNVRIHFFVRRIYWVECRCKGTPNYSICQTTWGLNGNVL